MSTLANQKPEVWAVIVSDDREKRTSFNITEWIETASDATLQACEMADWCRSGTEPIAYAYKTKVSEVAEVMAYAAEIENCGWEVYVSASEARRFFEVRRSSFIADCITDALGEASNIHTGATGTNAIADSERSSRSLSL
jgi:hypothetical protein